MAQFTVGTIDPQTTSGVQLASRLTSWKDAVHTMHSGTARPVYAVAGMTWLNVSNPAAHYLMYFDGSKDIPLMLINPQTAEHRPVSVFSYSPRRVVSFAASTTWTRLEWVRAVRLRVVGGGGGGGGASAASTGASAGGGGGGACYAETTFVPVGDVSSLTVTVGAGGNGGTGSSAGTGGNGGASAVYSGGTEIVRAGGGFGGFGTGAIAADFGGNGGGPLNHDGSGSHVAFVTAGSAGTRGIRLGNAPHGLGGNGGVGVFGGSGAGGFNSAGGVGVYGGGGGGGASHSGSAFNGGAGGGGLVIVEEYA